MAAASEAGTVFWGLVDSTETISGPGQASQPHGDSHKLTPTHAAPLSLALASNNHPRTRFSLTGKGGPQDLSEARRAARRGGGGGAVAGAVRRAASQAAGRRRRAPSMPRAGSNTWVLAGGRAVAPGGGAAAGGVNFWFEGAAPPGSCLTWRLLPEKGSRARRPPEGRVLHWFLRPSGCLVAWPQGHREGVLTRLRTINPGTADRAPALARPTHPGQAGLRVYTLSPAPPPCTQSYPFRLVVLGTARVSRRVTGRKPWRAGP